MHRHGAQASSKIVWRRLDALATILITGGAGFIGSHACHVLLQAGHRVIVIDNFNNSRSDAIARVAEINHLQILPPIPGQPWRAWADNRELILVEGDIRSADDLDRAFGVASAGCNGKGGPGVDAVIHFAGLKAVGESIREPLDYWDVNVAGSRTLLECMRRHHCRTLVFSSTAALYGTPDRLPISETAEIRPINPYGHTKAAVEQMLADMAASESGWRIARLRYFNPVGAHPSGMIGEDPNGVPSNLFPLISQAAAGVLSRVKVFGSDWPTPDGTGIRDYIHVMDLAEGHKEALDTLMAEGDQILTLNLGSGQGYSVLEMINAFESINGCKVPFEFVDKRPGDVARSIADPSEASRRLGWQAQRTLADICRDGWAWQQRNRLGLPCNQVTTA